MVLQNTLATFLPVIPTWGTSNISFIYIVPLTHNRITICITLLPALFSLLSLDRLKRNLNGR